MKKNKTITIEISGGVLTNVQNLPKGWDYELIDHDNCEAGDNPCKKCKS